MMSNDKVVETDNIPIGVWKNLEDIGQTFLMGIRGQRKCRIIEKTL